MKKTHAAIEKMHLSILTNAFLTFDKFRGQFTQIGMIYMTFTLLFF